MTFDPALKELEIWNYQFWLAYRGQLVTFDFSIIIYLTICLIGLIIQFFLWN